MTRKRVFFNFTNVHCSKYRNRQKRTYPLLIVLPYCACPGNEAWNEIQRKGTPITAYLTSSKARSNKVFPGLCSLEPFQIVDTTLLANKFLHHSFGFSTSHPFVTTTLAASAMHCKDTKIFELLQDFSQKILKKGKWSRLNYTNRRDSSKVKKEKSSIFWRSFFVSIRYSPNRNHEGQVN